MTGHSGRYTGGRRLLAALAAAAAIVLAALATSAAATVKSTTAGKTTLVVWHYLQGGQLAALKQADKLFNAAYPNVTVKYEFKPFAQMTPAILASAAAKQGPDVLLYQWGDMLKVDGVHGLKDMTAYWKSYKDRRRIPTGVVHSLNGKVLTVQPYSNLITLYYNKDILSQFGLTPPKTMDDLAAALKKVTAGGKEGLLLDGKSGVDGWWTGMPFLRADGVDIRMANKAAIESALARVAGWVGSGYIPRDVVTLNQQDVMNRFLAGNTAFAVNGNWELSHIRDAAKFAWDAVPIPSNVAAASVYLGGEGLAIGGFSKNPDLAWQYIQLAWLSKGAQVALPGSVGSLPVRADVANDPAITKVQGLAAFAHAVRTGTPLPLTAGESAAQTLFGDTFSAVLAGQSSPADAADKLFTQTPKLLASS